jgi:putative Ca2+/H+ antiporter (TMEM165/GDT1 family)
VGAGAIIWVIVIEILASAMGGYLAGRLRTRWVHVHTHEVYFRDTAHGFLVWCVSLVMTAAFLATAAASVVGATGSETATAAAQGQVSPNAYFVDSLFRSSRAERVDPSERTEAGLILARGIQEKDMPPADRTYLAQLVSARTGLSQTDAQARVSEVFDQARQSADNARKAAAHSLYWTFLALLIGAFCASFAATIGGKQRDRMAAATI